MKKYNIEGMHCASCKQNIEKSVSKLPNVKKVSADVNLGILTIEGNPNIKELSKAVEQTGNYKLKEEEVLAAHKSWNKALWSWIFAGPIATLMILHMMFMNFFMPYTTIISYTYILFSLPVIFWFGKDVYTSSYKALKNLTFNMDSLIALGTLASFITGVASLFFEVQNYAAIGAMIMAFHLTGKYIEDKARGKSSKAIKELMTLEAKQARIEKNGEVKEIQAYELSKGDVMIIKPGEKIPTDGIINEGSTSIDESMVTGESLPVDKKKGDKVIGSTINQDGHIKVKAQKLGHETFLSQIINMVEEAQGSKVPIQEFADKVTSIFVPTVITLAIITFLSWYIFPNFMINLASTFDFLPWINVELNTISLALFSAIAVLVIACPCALGLATPTTLLVSSGIGAKQGILIRNGEAIQTLNDVTTIVFDKTGTLTKGKPEVTDIKTYDISKKNVLQLAASIEDLSEHPIASAITKKFTGKKGKITNFKNLKGKGVQGKYNNKELLVGNTKLLDQHNISFDDVKNDLNKLEKKGKTTLIIAFDEEIKGIIAVADTVKPESKATISNLQNQGYKTVMLTGDNETTGKAIAKKLGIDQVIANILPNEKKEVIEDLQKKDLVAFVGDGVNDAPALKQSNVGIAMGTGTDVAIEAGDIVLVRGNIDGVPKALKLSKLTFKKIKQNLYWAYGYNVIAIPIAMLGLLHPVIAEIAMASSSISVVTNANLLKAEKIDEKP